jgi:hypothetical protein
MSTPLDYQLAGYRLLSAGDSVILLENLASQRQKSLKY